MRVRISIIQSPLCTYYASMPVSGSRQSWPQRHFTIIIEDTETTAEELRKEFGENIAELVAEMTDDKSLPKDERKRLQIEHGHRMSRDGAMIKLADKICNLRDVAATPPMDWSLTRQAEYFDWAKAVVDGLPLVSEKLLSLFDAAYAARPRA